MTWEETIIFARGQQHYQDLLNQCYLSADLAANIKHYGESDEFKEILNVLEQYAPQAKNMIEFGAGNGIASINFALQGYQVVSTEPDASHTVGAGAIKQSVVKLGLTNIDVVESYAEEISETDNKFDIVFARQCMHHANNLEDFVKNAYRMLKPGGLFLAVRDHVINSDNDKKKFLEEHAFHKYYGGENAFTIEQYTHAMTKAGFRINKILPYFESAINYFPDTDPLKTITRKRTELIKNKFPAFANSKVITNFLLKLFALRHGPVNDDSAIAGRMYSFIATK